MRNLLSMAITNRLIKFMIDQLSRQVSSLLSSQVTTQERTEF